MLMLGAMTVNDLLSAKGRGPLAVEGWRESAMTEPIPGRSWLSFISVPLSEVALRKLHDQGAQSRFPKIIIYFSYEIAGNLSFGLRLGLTGQGQLG
jgi:hypothetical protein